MESIILNGANATYTFNASPLLALEIQNIVFSVPMSGTLTDAYVQISGVASHSVYTFSDTTSTTVRFNYNEDVVFSGVNFGTRYVATINYIQTGDMNPYMTHDGSRVNNIQTPWRFTEGRG